MNPTITLQTAIETVEALSIEEQDLLKNSRIDPRRQEIALT